MQIVLCSLDALLESVKILRAHALDTRADVDKIKHQMEGVLVKLCQLRAELLGACPLSWIEAFQVGNRMIWETWAVESIPAVYEVLERANLTGRSRCFWPRCLWSSDQ